jgi:hypothetical protein
MTTGCFTSRTHFLNASLLGGAAVLAVGPLDKADPAKLTGEQRKQLRHD